MKRRWSSLGLLAAFVLATAGPAAAATPCWKRVMDDWTDNSAIDGVYSIACLQAALDHVPEDVRAYSSFEEQILQARQTAVRRLQSQRADPARPRARRGRASGSSRSSASQQPAPLVAREPEPTRPARGLFDAALNAGPSDAGSPPRPLIVLAAVALLLTSAGAAGLVARKLRARRGGTA